MFLMTVKVNGCPLVFSLARLKITVAMSKATNMTIGTMKRDTGSSPMSWELVASVGSDASATAESYR